MEGLVGILILGCCIWIFIRHPMKSLGCIFKMGFLFILGIAMFLAALYFGIPGMIEIKPPALNPMKTVLLTDGNYSKCFFQKMI